MKITDVLKRIDEADFPPLKIGDIDPRNGKKILSAMTSSDGTVVRSRFGDIYNVKYGEPDPAPVAPAPAPEAPPKPAEPEVAPTPAPAPEEPKPAEPEVSDTELLPDTPAAPEEVKCGPEVQAQIKQQKTFNSAYALAKKSGCTEFDWCQIVRVPGQGPKPAPDHGPDYTVAWDPNHQDKLDQGAIDLTIPAMANFTAEDVELEESAFVPGSLEVDRLREIAGTQVVQVSLEEAIGLDQVGKMKLPSGNMDREYQLKVQQACIGGRGTGMFFNPDPKDIPFINAERAKLGLPPWKESQSTKPNGAGYNPGPQGFKPADPNAATPAPAKGMPEIKASSKQAAIEIARKKGIKVFRFCGKYKVQDAKRGQGPKPAPKPTPKPEKKSSIGPRFYGQPPDMGDPRLQKAIDQGYIDSTGAGGAAGE